MGHLDMTERISFGEAGFVQSSLSGIVQLQEHQVRRSTLEVALHEIKLSEAQQEIHALQESNRLLTEQLQQARQEMFSASSEQSAPIALDAGAPVSVSTEPEPPAPKLRAVSNAGRKPLPADLPRRRIECDLSPEDKKCDQCAGEMVLVGEESSEQLDIIPAKLVVNHFVTKKYLCRCCNKFVASRAPKSVIPGSSFGSPALLADMVVNKFQFALPLYRLSQAYSRAGMKINRTTMANLMIGVADKLTPLYERFRETLLGQDVIHADETVLQVLKEPGRAPQTQSYMWQYCSGTHAAHQLALFEYQPTRAGAHALKFLTRPDGAVFHGYLQADGYAGYNMVDAATRVGCMAHVRRKFIDALRAVPKEHASASAAKIPIDLIQRLYVIEAQMKMATIAERSGVRLSDSVPLLNQLKDWLDEQAKCVPPKSLVGKAIFYALGQWSNVIRFVDDGRLSIDNNIAERSIKAFVIGRKNWLFSNSVDGANATAVLTTMVRSALANKLDPYQYMVTVLKKLPHAQTETDFQELMPWNVRACLDEDVLNERITA